MPELPEAETIARGLARGLVGKTARRVRLLRRDMLKSGRPGDLEGLAGQRVRSVTRRGKFVVIEFRRARLVLGLGMAGRPHLARARHPFLPHTHLVVAFGGDVQFRYADSRRIGSGIHLLGPGESGPLGRLGPDADTISREEFLRRLGGRRSPIKGALLNQSILAGVGNIYSQEALFRAGIRPDRRVDGIGLDRLARLHSAIRKVLAEAIAAGGSTITRSNPYADPEGRLGEFAVKLRVYGRYGRPCVRCRARLLRTAIAARTTTFCPRCQT